MIGEKESKNLDAISLSKNTVKRRIADMSNDVLQQIVRTSSKEISSSFDSIGRVHRYGRPSIPFCVHSYINNTTISEDFLFCKALKLHTKGEDIFQCLNSFFSEYSIPWDNCAGICTNGAAACTGFSSGAVKRIQEKASNAKWTHCFL